MHCERKEADHPYLTIYAGEKAAQVYSLYLKTPTFFPLSLEKKKFLFSKTKVARQKLVHPNIGIERITVHYFVVVVGFF